jgi:hypothetical protein
MANKQGKFWEESSEEEEEDFFSSEEDGDDVKETPKQQQGRSTWEKGSTDPDEWNDEKREVRAKTDKANEALEKLVETLRQYQIANDWNNISKGRLSHFFCTTCLSSINSLFCLIDHRIHCS